MNFSLTASQEHRIASKLQSGKYHSPEEVLEVALGLLDEYDRADDAWAEEVRTKIDAAIVTSAQTPAIDGETFVNQVLERFQQSKLDFIHLLEPLPSVGSGAPSSL
jgi:antitoxin ParD1/3/4